MKNLLLILFTLLLFTACGGGGGDSSTPAASEEPVLQTQPEPVSEEPAESITLSRTSALKTVTGSNVIVSDAESSNDIVVPAGFDLKTEQTFNLAVNHPNTGADAYLSVCTDYETRADGSFNIDYDTCVIRTSLEFDTFDAEIAVTNDVEQLVAALWFLDTSIDPIYVDWTLAELTED